MRLHSLAFVLLLSACPADAPRESIVAPDDSVVDPRYHAATLRRAASSSAKEGLKIESFHTDVEVLSGDYARVRIWATSYDEEPLYAYMQWSENRWHGVALGSGLDRDELLEVGIPESIIADSPNPSYY